MCACRDAPRLKKQPLLRNKPGSFLKEGVLIYFCSHPFAPGPSFMATQKKPTPETFAFRAEMQQLLHLIIHSLYTHEEIFLRELISNASDALNKIHFRLLTDRNVVDPDAARDIRITLDKDARTLTIADTGIGMSREDLVERIGTVASSGTLDFIKELKKDGGPVDAQLIGQFGVGFYSAFMVADTITIDTRAAHPDSVGLRWSSDGAGSFTIEETDRTSRGTRITLHLKEDKAEFAEEWRVKQIIRKYSNFVDFPILIGEERVNTVDALWHRSKSDLKEEELNEFYKFISGDAEDPLGHLFLNIEGRMSFRALLFIPQTAPRSLFHESYKYGVHLYSSNVFIQDDCQTLLPEYLKCVRGVVDTEDLPLNVSREATQHSPVMAKIRKILTSKLLGLLGDWATNEPEKYATFFKQFGILFKTGLGGDFENRDTLIDLLRYESTATEPGAYTSFQQYVDRMATDQEALYYVLAENRLAAERNPNLEYFRAHDLEVLLLTDPVDAFLIPGIPTYADHPLQSVEKADLKLQRDPEEEEEGGLSEHEAEKIVERIKSVLGDRVEDVRISQRLVDSAATLVTGSAGMDTQMERMMMMMDASFEGGKKVLEINIAHPLIRNLSSLRGTDDTLVEQAVLQLFEGTLLAEGSLKEPQDFVARMLDLLVVATKPTTDEAS